MLQAILVAAWYQPSACFIGLCHFAYAKVKIGHMLLLKMIDVSFIPKYKSSGLYFAQLNVALELEHNKLKNDW